MRQGQATGVNMSEKTLSNGLGNNGFDVSACIAGRHSCKAFDPHRSISAETVRQLEDLLRLSPSSINSQPWHFVMAATQEGKDSVAQSMLGVMSYNAEKVRAASHVVVLCGLHDISDAHIADMVAQEDTDGRYHKAEDREQRLRVCRTYVGMHQEAGTVQAWVDRQVYLALGTLLLGAAALGLDACPIEGFDATQLDSELGLTERGLRSLVVVALGYGSEHDFNAALPKSRFPAERVFSRI